MNVGFIYTYYLCKFDGNIWFLRLQEFSLLASLHNSLHLLSLFRSHYSIDLMVCNYPEWYILWVAFPLVKASRFWKDVFGTLSLLVPLFLKVPVYSNCLSVFTLSYDTNIFIYTLTINYSTCLYLTYNCVDIWKACTFMGSSLLHHGISCLRLMLLSPPKSSNGANGNFA